ncbi:MAG: acyltransferase [Halioglobus sp.]
MHILNGEKSIPANRYYPNFDYIRLWAALQVVAVHTGMGFLAIFDPVTLFIAVSGFVVLGSMERRNSKEFFLSRALRVLPLLLVSFVAVGILHGWLAALDNFLYWLWPWQKLTVVNAVVWTLIYEEILYVVMAILNRLGFYRHYMFPLLLGTGLAALAYYMGRYVLPGAFQYFGAAFFIGSALYLVRQRIEKLPAFAVTLLLVSSCALAAAGFNYPLGPTGMPVYFLAYTCIIMFCIAGPQLPKLPIDLSYSMYLLHLIVLSMMWGHFTMGSTMFIVVVSITTMLGVASWYLVEKPALAIKAKFGNTELHLSTQTS